MLGLMQDRPLMISAIIAHAARSHGQAEVVSRTLEGDIHRTTYSAIERRARRLARVLQQLGVRPADRVATLAWNGYRHLELYYAISGMQAVCHTINPRLSHDDVAYIATHAEDRVIFVEACFIGLIEAIAPRLPALHAVVVMTDRALMPTLALPAAIDVLCYEDLMAAADDEYVWPEFDERTAASLCYTSGTTGRPKGVLYSHRSTLLHAYGANMPDALSLRAVDRMLPVVPMFHVNAWGTPYAAPMSGTALIMPGRHLDGASLTELMNTERVTVAAGVPTVWLGLLRHLQATHTRLATVRRLVIGGSACPRMLIEAFAHEQDVRIEHAWGMSEVSPIGTFNRPKASNAHLDGEDALRLAEKQGRAVFGMGRREGGPSASARSLGVQRLFRRDGGLGAR
jgi:acyl-CoA synthetase (AMP-forming)/AMP-acid ligase II